MEEQDGRLVLPWIKRADRYASGMLLMKEKLVGCSSDSLVEPFGPFTVRVRVLLALLTASGC